MIDYVITVSLMVALIAFGFRTPLKPEGVSLANRKTVFITFPNRTTSMTATAYRHTDGLWYVAMHTQPDMTIEELNER